MQSGNRLLSEEGGLLPAGMDESDELRGCAELMRLGLLWLAPVVAIESEMERWAELWEAVGGADRPLSEDDWPCGTPPSPCMLTPLPAVNEANAVPVSAREYRPWPRPTRDDLGRAWAMREQRDPSGMAELRRSATRKRTGWFCTWAKRWGRPDAGRAASEVTAFAL